jgi:hypothetical protein
MRDFEHGPLDRSSIPYGNEKQNIPGLRPADNSESWMVRHPEPSQQPTAWDEDITEYPVKDPGSVGRDVLQGGPRITAQDRPAQPEIRLSSVEDINAGVLRLGEAGHRSDPQPAAGPY